MLAVSTLVFAAVAHADGSVDFKLSFPEQCQDKAEDCAAEPLCEELFHNGVEEAFETTTFKGCEGNPVCIEMLECVKDHADNSNTPCFEEVFDCMMSDECVTFLTGFREDSSDPSGCGGIPECAALLRCQTQIDAKCGDKGTPFKCEEEFRCEFNEDNGTCQTDPCVLEHLNCGIDAECAPLSTEVNAAGISGKPEDYAKANAKAMKNNLYKEAMKCETSLDFCEDEYLACLEDETCALMIFTCSSDDNCDQTPDGCLDNAACKAMKECNEARRDSMYKVNWNVQICCIHEDECEETYTPLAEALDIEADNVDVECEKVAPTVTENRRRAEIKEGTFKVKYTILVEKKDDADKIKTDLAKEDIQNDYKRNMKNEGLGVETLQAEEATIEEPKKEDDSDDGIVGEVKEKIKDTVNKLSAGAIAGIVIGVVVFIVGLLVVVCFCCKCKLNWS